MNITHDMSNDLTEYDPESRQMDIVVRRYLPNDLRRASHGDDVRRNVLRDDGARADDRIVPDMRPGRTVTLDAIHTLRPKWT